MRSTYVSCTSIFMDANGKHTIIEATHMENNAYQMNGHGQHILYSTHLLRFQFQATNDAYFACFCSEAEVDLCSLLVVACFYFPSNVITSPYSLFYAVISGQWINGLPICCCCVVAVRLLYWCIKSRCLERVNPGHRLPLYFLIDA